LIFLKQPLVNESLVHPHPVLSRKLLCITLNSFRESFWTYGDVSLFSTR